MPTALLPRFGYLIHVHDVLYNIPVYSVYDECVYQWDVCEGVDQLPGMILHHYRHFLCVSKALRLISYKVCLQGVHER